MLISKELQSRLKHLISETVTMLCKNTLPFNAELNLEGLLGITLDNENIVLVSIKENLREKSKAAKEKEKEKEKEKTPDVVISDSPPPASPHTPRRQRSQDRQQQSPGIRSPQTQRSPQPTRSPRPNRNRTSESIDLTEGGDDVVMVDPVGQNQSQPPPMMGRGGPRMPSPGQMPGNQNAFQMSMMNARRKRTMLSMPQRALLEKAYLSNSRPQIQDLHKLADDLKLDREVVKTWFYNRRAAKKPMGQFPMQGFQGGNFPGAPGRGGQFPPQQFAGRGQFPRGMMPGQGQFRGQFPPRVPGQMPPNMPPNIHAIAPVSNIHSITPVQSQPNPSSNVTVVQPISDVPTTAHNTQTTASNLQPTSNIPEDRIPAFDSDLPDLPADNNPSGPLPDDLVATIQSITPITPEPMPIAPIANDNPSGIPPPDNANQDSNASDTTASSAGAEEGKAPPPRSPGTNDVAPAEKTNEQQQPKGFSNQVFAKKRGRPRKKSKSRPRHDEDDEVEDDRSYSPSSGSDLGETLQVNLKDFDSSQPHRMMTRHKKRVYAASPPRETAGDEAGKDSLVYTDNAEDMNPLGDLLNKITTKVEAPGPSSEQPEATHTPPQHEAEEEPEEPPPVTKKEDLKDEKQLDLPFRVVEGHDERGEKTFRLVPTAQKSEK